MDQLTVIRASAGSGKTHELTGYYLNLLMENNEQYFKNILAVTFTNKATAEMKQRVIEELHKLATGKHSLFIEKLTSKFNLTEQDIRSKAAGLLKRVLHEYSWFSIETIDTFFQRIIRAFSREMGLPGNYTLELNPDVAVEYAVDQLIDSSGSDKELLSWLTRYTLEKIGEGKTWDFKNDLLKLGKQLFNEVYMEHSDTIREALSDTQSLIKLRDSWLEQKAKFEAKCKQLGQEGIGIIENAGLSLNDFHGKSRGVNSIFNDLIKLKFENSSGQLIPQRNITLRLLESPDNWAVAGSKNETAVCNLASAKLLPYLQDIAYYLDSNYKEYLSIKVMLTNLFPLGILVKLGEKLREYRLEENTFILSDATMLINKLVKDNDTSFIYEKMGNRYRNFLIDEFQDTSSMQWLNFKPLVDNSLSQANDCLLVGDVKQSIYRWRNGEWEILARKIPEQYSSEVLTLKQLTSNWRSCPEVVKFNNAVFPLMVNGLSSALVSEFSEAQLDFESHIKLLQTVYSDVTQQVPDHKPAGGNVQVQFFSAKQTKENTQYYKDPIIENINNLLDKGYNAGDIAVLVRYKSEGKKIADLLIELNNQGVFSCDIQIISNESLFLSASSAVQLLISGLEYLSKPDELLNKMKVATCYHGFSEMISAELNLSELEEMFGALPNEFVEKTDWLRSLPLYELVEYLAGIFDIHAHETELAYIHSFYDVVHEFTQVNTGNIDTFLEFWEEIGSECSVTASESQNAIRIVTIHKSKGLEYRAVIIPFCDWDLDQKPNSLFWVDVPDSSIAGLPVYPVNYSKALRHTMFSEAYYQEKFRSYVDNINMLYVAMTRAVETLIVLSEYRPEDKGVKTIGDILYQSINTSTDNHIAQNYNRELSTYNISSAEHSVDSESSTTVNEYISVVEYSSAMDRLYFSAQAQEYFDDDNPTASERKVRGKRLHAILAGMKTRNDINTRIGKAVYEGLIDPKEGVELQRQIEDCLQSDRVERWFDGTGEVYNEMDLLLPGGNTKRPDRVIVWDDEVHVIDYKFGSDKEEHMHKKQVNDYVTLLLKMGYRAVKGYLWYIDMNEVVEI